MYGWIDEEHKRVFSVGDQTAVGVWTPQCSISSTGNMTTNDTITSPGLINGCSLSVPGDSPASALIPIVAGVHLNN